MSPSDREYIAFLFGLGLGLSVALAVLLLARQSKRSKDRARAGRLRDLRVLVGLALAFLWTQEAASQVVRLRESGGGGAASAVTPGTTTVTGCQNRVLFGDNSSLLNCEAALGYTASTDTLATTAGTGSGLWEFSGQTNISGPDATTNVGIGSTANDANAGTGGTSVVIGNGATNTANGTGTVVIGSLAAATTGSIDSIAIGRAASTTNHNALAIGAATAAANASVALGNGAQAAVNSIAIGNSSVSAANELVAGSVSITTNNLYFGKGKVSTTATGWTANGTGGFGADNAGADAFVAGGKGTGTAKGGATGFLRPLRAATSSTPQNLSPAVVVCPTMTLSNTSATAQTIATITTTTTTAGSVTVDYTSTASNGTLLNADSGMVKVSWNNNAGTVAAAMTAVALQSDSDASGTLASTPTVTVATNVVSIKLTPTWATIVPTRVTGYATFTVASSGDTVVCQ